MNSPPPNNIMHNTMYDVSAQQNFSSGHTDAVMGMPLWAAKENTMAHPGLTVPRCTCNGTTGPCPGHMEQIRAQVLASASSPLQKHQHSNFHAPEVDSSAPFGCLSTGHGSYSPPKPR
jgi:hypothetical protein